MPGLSYTTDGGVIEYVSFDAMTEEGHSRSATATQKGVELGAPVVDHVRPNQPSITFRAVVTNKPSRNVANDATATGQMSSVALEAKTRARKIGTLIAFPGGVIQPTIELPQPTSINATLLTFAQPFDRVGAVHEKLIRLLNTATTLNISTTLEELSDMVLIGLDVIRDAERGNSLDAKLTFVKIRKVTTATVEVPRSIRSGNRGGQATTEPTPAEADRGRAIQETALFQLFG